MSEYPEYSDLELLLSELPEVTLPESLTAETLFSKMDAMADAPKTVKFLSLPRRWKPMLAYAAAFAVLVLVYYSAGLNRTGSQGGLEATPAPAAAAPQAMMASEESMEDTGAPLAENGAMPKAAETPQSSSAQGDMASPRMAAADDPNDYYRALVSELNGPYYSKRYAGEDPTSPAEPSIVRQLARKDDQNGDLLYTYDYNPEGNSTVTIQNNVRYSNLNAVTLGSFSTQGDSIIDLVPLDQTLYVLEQVDYRDGLYTGDALTELLPGAGSLRPDCGGVLITRYNIADPQAVTISSSLLQEGSYRSHIVQDGQLLVTSVKTLALPQEGGALLCDLAPMMGDTLLTHAIAPEDVRRYPPSQAEKPEEYLLLSALGGTAAQPTIITKAVLGSGLSFQPSGKTSFILSETAVSGTQALDSFSLGDIMVEMR